MNKMKDFEVFVRYKQGDVYVIIFFNFVGGWRTVAIFFSSFSICSEKNVLSSHRTYIFLKEKVYSPRSSTLTVLLNFLTNNSWSEIQCYCVGFEIVLTAILQQHGQ